MAHQLSHSPAITSLSSRLSQDLSPDPTEWLWFSRIPKGTGAGRALHMAQPITNPAQSSTRCLHPRGPGSWWMEDTEAPGTSPGTQELPIPIWSFPLPIPSPRLAPVGRVEGARWEGTAVLGGWLGETLTHASGLVLAAALGQWVRGGGAHKGYPGTAGLRVTHSWAAGSLSSLAGT